MSGGSYWDELERPGPDAVNTPGGELRAGTRVRLHPRAGGDVFDIALAGQGAVVEAIEQDVEGRTTVAVVLDDDPGRDLGFARQPGHRFFFAPEELEVVGVRILVAGIGNVFLGDDGFGVALADRLARRELPAGTTVADYGIRGMDLAFAVIEGYDAIVLLDATPRGGEPGTLYVIEVDPDQEAEITSPGGHGMDPLQVIGLARSFGGPLPPMYVVGCEPGMQLDEDSEDIVASLSAPVHAALNEAGRIVVSLCADIARGTVEINNRR